MGCNHSDMLRVNFNSAENLQKGNMGLKNSSISLRSAILIQNWYRGYKARLETRRRCTWMIYQSIEYSGEQDQLKLHNFFLDLLTLVGQQNMPENSLFNAALDRSKSILGADSDENNIIIEETYSGPVITFPITLKVITTLIEAFSNKEVLHAYYVFELLIRAKEQLKSRSNIVHIDTSISHQITVCGDLHGQFQDLITIFERNSYPDPSNPYVFNGDFVDRGEFSIEVFIILLSFFILYPGSVFLNRGNHEDRIMNLRYGFIKEVQLKYKNHASVLLNLLSDVFRWLPLASVINKKVFVCHGGISDRVKLKMLEVIDRTKFISILNYPHTLDSDREEWHQVLDILWSDPKPQDGCSPNQFRGGGCYFGPDISQEFLETNNFDILIRSHECKPDGYEWCHGNRVLTIFSASNYYDINSNSGAYVKFNKKMEPKIISFNAQTESLHRLPQNQTIRRVEESALRELRTKILTNRSELMQEFLNHDSFSTGTINCITWCQIMTKVLNLELPWHNLRRQLATTDENGQVVYSSMFDVLIHNKTISDDKDESSVTEDIYKYRDTLETVFRILDSDNSGKISMEEFKEGCKILKRHTGNYAATDYIEDLAHSIDINKDGFIDLNEFLEAFRITENAEK